MTRISSALVPRLAFKCVVAYMSDVLGYGLFARDADNTGAS